MRTDTEIEGLPAMCAKGDLARARKRRGRVFRRACPCFTPCLGPSRSKTLKEPVGSFKPYSVTADLAVQ